MSLSYWSMTLWLLRQSPALYLKRRSTGPGTQETLGKHLMSEWMNENYLSRGNVYIFIFPAKYISKDVDVYYSLKKIYSLHVLKTFNNLSGDAYFSDLYVKSVSKLLRCHKTSVDVPRSMILLSAEFSRACGWSASWLQFLPHMSSIQFWGTFCFSLCPRSALPHCDSMTARCCLLCGWPLRKPWEFCKLMHLSWKQQFSKSAFSLLKRQNFP